VPPVVKVWDTTTGQIVFTRPLSQPVEGHRFCFSGSGQRLAVLHWGKFDTPNLRTDDTLLVWDTVTRKELLKVQGHFNPGLALSSDGKRVAAADAAPGNSALARVWDVDTGQAVLLGDGGLADRFLFSPDGSRLVVDTRIWDTGNGKELCAITLGSPLFFNADGKTILVINRDGDRNFEFPSQIHTFDGDTGKKVRSVQMKADAGFPLAFHGQRRRLAGAPQGRRLLCIWDAETGERLVPLMGHSAAILATAFSQDGKRLFSVDQFGTLKVWDARLAEERAYDEYAAKKLGPEAVTILSPDGLLEAVYYLGAKANRTDVSIRDSSGKELLLFQQHKKPLARIVFSPDSRLVVSQDISGAFLIWDPRTGDLCLNLPRLKEAGWAFFMVQSVPQFSADSRRLAMQDGDGWIQVVNVGAWKPVSPFKVQATLYVLSPDGKRLVTLFNTRTRANMQLWNVETGAELLVLNDKWGEDGIYHARAIFSPDGRRFAFHGTKTTVVVDALTGAELAKLPFSFTSTFSRDGARLAVYLPKDSSQSEAEFMVWDIGTGTERFRLKGHMPGSLVGWVAFSLDGKRIATIVAGGVPLLAS
jgi:WD40 repeat protein